MDINSAFSSDYLKATDLQGRRVMVTIESVSVEKIADEDKPIVYFQGKAKGLILNKTNANMITEIVGSSETDEWRGREIVLYVAKVDFQGRKVDAVRVDAPPDSKPKSAATGGDGVPF